MTNHKIIQLIAATGLLIGFAHSSMSMDYALIIGIDGYPSFPEGRKLKYAKNDAEQFANFILSREGGNFKRENVRLLLSSQATRLQIMTEINWLAERANPEDKVYIFFSGHGVVDRKTQEVYFMPYESSPYDPNLAGIKAPDFLKDINQRIDARSIIFILDACHSGAAIGDQQSKGTSLTVNSKVIDAWQDAQGTNSDTKLIFVSTDGAEESFEDDDLKMGIFTYFLLKGLKGEAQYDENGYITAGRVSRYLIDSVQSYANRKHNSKQTPKIHPSRHGTFVMAIREPKAKSGKYPHRIYNNDKLLIQETDTIENGLVTKRLYYKTNSTLLSRKVETSELATKTTEYSYDTENRLVNTKEIIDDKITYTTTQYQSTTNTVIAYERTEKSISTGSTINSYLRKFAYDAKGNLVSIENSNGIKYKLMYNLQGKVSVVIDSDRIVYYFKYNSTGAIVSIEIPKIGRISLAYGGDGGRQVKKMESVGGTSILTQVSSLFESLLEQAYPISVFATNPVPTLTP
jgi:YD repeat-containing protein